jgi:hypothetical protein
MAKKLTPKPKLPGPLLAVAVFCEQTVEDKDNTISCIRIVDTVFAQLTPDAPADFPSEENRLLVGVRGLISIRRGGSRKKFHKLKLTMESPTGKSSLVDDRQIEIGAEPYGGFNLRFGATIGIHMGGLFWLIVSLNGEEFARVPLRIVIERAAAHKSHEQPARASAKNQ